MKRSILISAALAALAGCNNEPETIVAGPPDTQAKELATAPPVELPPSIQVSRTYRCKDNSLVSIDFYTNNTAQIRNSESGETTTLTAPAAGQAYTAEGYSVSGNGTSIEFTGPAGAQSCKA